MKIVLQFVALTDALNGLNQQKDFPLFINRKKVSELSGADELFDLQLFQVKTIQEPGYVWFSNADDIDIEEESVLFPTYNEVISIIHLKMNYE